MNIKYKHNTGQKKKRQTWLLISLGEQSTRIFVAILWSLYVHTLYCTETFVYHHYIHSDQEQDPLDLIQYSALRLSSRYITTIVCVIIFFLWSQRNSSASWYYIWSGDLQTCAHKSRNANHRPWGLLWCLEVWAQFWWGGIQKNNHGLGNENWNRSQAGSSLKCFRMHPESKGPVISSFYGALNSYRSCHYPALTLLIFSSSSCFHEIVSVKLQPQQ